MSPTLMNKKSSEKFSDVNSLFEIPFMTAPMLVEDGFITQTIWHLHATLLSHKRRKYPDKQRTGTPLHFIAPATSNSIHALCNQPVSSVIIIMCGG